LNLLDSYFILVAGGVHILKNNKSFTAIGKQKIIKINTLVA
jgi:hypothetical protein